MPDQPAKAQRFEVGDRVRILGDKQVESRSTKGKLARIVEPPFRLRDGVFAVKLDRPWHAPLCCFSADELEPAAHGEGGDAK